MTWLEAVVAVLDAWAWPVIVLIAVLLLRKNIAELIDRIKRLTGPAGTSAEFTIEAAATEKIAEIAVPDAAPELPQSSSTSVDVVPFVPSSLPDLMAEAQDRPNAAIIIAYTLVEHAAQAAFGYDRRAESLERFFRGLAAQNLVAPLISSVVHRFEGLYDQVAEGSVSPTADAADNFVNIAWRLLTTIRQAETLKREGSGWNPPGAP